MPGKEPRRLKKTSLRMERLPGEKSDGNIELKRGDEGGDGVTAEMAETLI